MCVTFTNAAVHEMEARIRSILEKLTVSDDSQIISYLNKVLNIKIVDEFLINRAKSLIFSWQENTHSLSIVTIHSFCQNLLRKYPIEAEIHPEFTIIDDIEIEDYINLAKKNFFNNTIKNLDNSVSTLSRFLSTHYFEELLEKIFELFPKFRRFTNKNPDIDLYIEHLKKIFHIEFYKNIPNKYMLKFKNIGEIENYFLTKTGNIRKNLNAEEM
jgi:ATP-dependent helicase/nuclease subunit A